ncbi:hypothetical protein SAMN04487848_1221 [Microbacterium sp. ru370.1]|uniref:hypothetical protein n=1 Tax=unclassified Microbacterium TaxID=2609290 RepID=UPI00088A9450|nr:MULTISPECIES: hypothetical protein [unclassified Microbacterium]SDO50729.1 hypothetical protein SAMN04487848_1221 [Microbacterium sp. ru370.1]SIT83203.1 hypothetical protein SAMN05880579_1217 [Microbacterium sp. RU1D]
MTAHLLLHAAALVCSVIASCCATSGPLPQRRERVLASVLMTAAMLDGAVLHVAPPIAWAGVLVATAIIVSAGRRVRAGRGGDGVYGPSGLVVMAALVASSAHGVAVPVAAHPAHAPASGPAALLAVCAALAVVHVAVSVQRARHRTARRDRAHHAAMGGSTALMTMTALL